METFSSFLGFNKQLLLYIVFIIIYYSTPNLYAQENTLNNTEVLPNPDSSEPKTNTVSVLKKPKQKFGENHSPRNAVLFGIIPGGGQIYNRRYWKLPIVYAGIGGLGYWAYYSRSNFLSYRRAYKAEIDDDPFTRNSAYADIGPAQLKLLRDQSLQQFEYAMVGFFAFYLLTITDAFVDAHLMKFNIDDDLSMQIRPSVQYHAITPNSGLQQGLSGGLSIQLNLRPRPKSMHILY